MMIVIVMVMLVVVGVFADGGDWAVAFIGEFGIVGLHGACSWADAWARAARDVHAWVDVFGKFVEYLLWYFHLVQAELFEIHVAGFDPSVESFAPFLLYDLVAEQEEDAQHEDCA